MIKQFLLLITYLSIIQSKKLLKSEKELDLRYEDLFDFINDEINSFLTPDFKNRIKEYDDYFNEYSKMILSKQNRTLFQLEKLLKINYFIGNKTESLTQLVKKQFSNNIIDNKIEKLSESLNKEYFDTKNLLYTYSSILFEVQNETQNLIKSFRNKNTKSLTKYNDYNLCLNLSEQYRKEWEINKNSEKTWNLQKETAACFKDSERTETEKLKKCASEMSELQNQLIKEKKLIEKNSDQNNEEMLFLRKKYTFINNKFKKCVEEFKFNFNIINDNTETIENF